MEYLITGIIFYILIFMIYYIFVVRKQKRYNYKKIPAEVAILESYYKIDVKKIGYKKVLKILNFINPLMLTILLMIVLDIKSITLKILILSILMLPSIWFVYYLIALYLKKIEGKKE